MTISSIAVSISTADYLMFPATRAEEIAGTVSVVGFSAALIGTTSLIGCGIWFWLARVFMHRAGDADSAVAAELVVPFDLEVQHHRRELGRLVALVGAARRRRRLTRRLLLMFAGGIIVGVLCFAISIRLRGPENHAELNWNWAEIGMSVVMFCVAGAITVGIAAFAHLTFDRACLSRALIRLGVETESLSGLVNAGLVTDRTSDHPLVAEADELLAWFYRYFAPFGLRKLPPSRSGGGDQSAVFADTIRRARAIGLIE